METGCLVKLEELEKSIDFQGSEVENIRFVCPHRLVGLGHRPFTPATGVQIPLGTPESASIHPGDVAQLGERNAGSVEVRGSIPLVSTTP